MRIALVLSLILAILAVIFALQNPAYIDVNLGPFEFRGSTALILLVTFCLGVIVGILAAVPTLVRRRRRVRQLEREAGAGRVASTTTTDTGPAFDTATPREHHTP